MENLRQRLGIHYLEDMAEFQKEVRFMNYQNIINNICYFYSLLRHSLKVKTKIKVYTRIVNGTIIFLELVRLY